MDNSPIDLDKVIQFRRCGRNFTYIAKCFNLPYQAFLDKLPPNYIQRRGGEPIFLPLEEVYELFQEGVSTNTLAKKFGVGRSDIDAVLRYGGFTPRNSSDAMFARMKNSTEEERQTLTASAHAAIRGYKYSFEELCRRATSRQRTFDANKLYGNELIFYEKYGPGLIPQFAVGPYNLDFGIAGTPITVEINGGNFHLFGKHARVFAERSP